MTQVTYTKVAYQEAKKTPPKERTEAQNLLVKIDFRQGPNPVLRTSTGAVIIMTEGTLLEGDADGNIGIVLPKTPKEANKLANPAADPREKDSGVDKEDNGTDRNVSDEKSAFDANISKGAEASFGGFGTTRRKTAQEMVADAKANKKKEE